MTMPSPSAEDYVSLVDSVFSVGGTYVAPSGGDPASVTGGVEFECQEGTFEENVDVDDMTAGAFYEDVQTIAKATVTGLKINYKVGAIPDFKAGQIYPCVIFNPKTTWVRQGKFRFNKVSAPILNVKNGLTFSAELTSQGTYTGTN